MDETKQDEDGNTIDHAEGNELHDTLLAQNLAEHLAAEDLLESTSVGAMNRRRAVSFPQRNRLGGLALSKATELCTSCFEAPRDGY